MQPERYSQESQEPLKNSSVNSVICPWWGKALLGILLLWGADKRYHDLKDIEEGRVKELWLTKRDARTYENFGKWPVIVSPGIAGVGILAWGVWHRFTGREKFWLMMRSNSRDSHSDGPPEFDRSA